MLSLFLFAMSILDHESSMEQKGFWDASPKTTFLTGLFLGISVSSIIALLAVLLMLTSSRVGTQAAVNTPPAQQQPAPTGADPSAQQPPAQPVAAVTDKDHIRGPKDAKVTLIEYSDFQCPFCSRHEPTMAKILKDFPKDVRLVYRHYPLSFHPNAQKAGEASECAAKLGGNDAFWTMHDKLFAANEALNGAVNADFYQNIAKDMRLDVNKFKSCMDSGETASIISADAASGNNSGVEGTPATFVNGKLVSGAVPYETFKASVVSAGAKN